ncbi:putative MxaK-like protein [Paraburkholderia piptadeniae]|uniref:MxaK-like protein n=1 Tax=Paraburkholderia piptadeniae TaxID=1701573 RepID=A0A1N7S0Z8_9BURK|nr:MxaK protein [Paraburkholderia piptadeniae]SIT41070.1 putative MxaK-like protein [Paraburkholderia piptadeniae]
MKRLPIHLMFGAATLCCAAVAGYNAVRLLHVAGANREIAAISTQPPSQWSKTAANQQDPAVRLAQAVALARAGQHAEAGKLYYDLGRLAQSSETGRIALYDLANMYLREAAGDDAQGPVRSPPMLESAKARYREVLRLDPGDWDARYNLERALRLAPEAQDTADDEKDIKEQHNINVRGAAPEELP